MKRPDPAPPKKLTFKNVAGDWSKSVASGTFWSSGTAISSATPISISFDTTSGTTTTWPTFWASALDVQKVIFVAGNEGWLEWADAIMPGFGDWLDRRDPHIPFHFSHAAFFYAGD